MPIQYCKVNGKKGYRWGRKGKCYSARAKALRQARAIEASKHAAYNAASIPLKSLRNPLKLDPTRTATLRRAFSTALKKRFRKLRMEVMELVDREDVFGLKVQDMAVLNSFCPTGKGGGVDPTCSPGKNTISSRASEDYIRYGTEMNAALRSGGQSEYQESIDNLTKEIDRSSLDKPLTVFRGVSLERGDEYSRMLTSEGSEFTDAGFTSTNRWTSGIIDTVKLFTPPDKFALVSIRLPEGSKAAHNEIGETVIQRGTTYKVSSVTRDEKGSYAVALDVVRQRGVTANVFCATGPGGGKDPTCSPKSLAPSKFSLATAYAKSLPAQTLAKIRDVAKSKHTQLEKRYGSKYAKAIIGAAMMMAPTTTLVLVGVAEMHRLISPPKPTGNEMTESEHEMSQEEIDEAARKLLEELEEDLREESTENVYCPNGPGGGKDPTCSPKAGNRPLSEKGFEKVEAMRDKAIAKLERKWDREDTKQEREYDREGERRRNLDERKLNNMESAKDKALDRLTEAYQKQVDAVEGPDEDPKVVAKLAQLEKNYDEMFDEINTRMSKEIEQTEQRMDKDYDEWARRRNVERLQAAYERDKRRDKELADLHAKYERVLYPGFPPDPPLTGNQRWRFNTAAEKVKAFQAWLKARLQQLIHSEEAKSVWQYYIEEGLRKGAGRAFDDTRKIERTKAAREEKLDFYNGTKQEFLRSAFNQPVAVEKVQLLAGRTFDELENVTAQMSTAMSRTLTDGLVQGKSPREIARDLGNNVANLGEKRALVVARTEIIRAHADGQLEALEQLGVEEVGVSVEWSGSGLGVTKRGNPSPCPACAPLVGVVLTLEEAKGKIPYHPNCMCAWIPAGVGESTQGQKSSQVAIKAAVKESVSKGGVWGKTPIAKKRTKSILGNQVDDSLMEFSRLLNTFCPTGKGGGVDPTCSPGKGQKKAPPVVPEGKIYIKGKGLMDVNPLARTPPTLEQEMEVALRKYAEPDTIKEFVSYSATEESVPISALLSPQSVRGESVDYFKDNPEMIDSAGDLKLPLVIQYGPHMVLRDGNSRATAAKELGRTHIKARVVYVPQGV